MNVSKKDYNDCHKLKKYLEKALNKTIIIKDSDDNCFIKVTKNDEKQIKNILNKRRFKLSPLFYK